MSSPSGPRWRSNDGPTRWASTTATSSTASSCATPPTSINGRSWSGLDGVPHRAASALAEALGTAGRLRDAADATARALELAPCDELLLQNLVSRLVAAGNPAGAEAVGRAFIERLERELGVSPSAETMRVLRDARAPKRRGRGIDVTAAALISQGRYHWHQRTTPRCNARSTTSRGPSGATTAASTHGVGSPIRGSCWEAEPMFRSARRSCMPRWPLSARRRAR